MKRLKKLADDQVIEDQNEQSLPEETNNSNFAIVQDLLKRVNSNCEDIKSSYYSLLENLNALNKDFPGVYNELKVMVKLPNKNDVNNISDLKNDMENALTMLTDQTFLSGLVK